MGRPEAPLDGQDEALREFAARLRRLREESGGRSYRQLSQSANFAAQTLARAASGRSLPSWDVTRAYVAACGGNPAQWRPIWARAAEQARRAAAAAAGPPVSTARILARQLPADLHDFVGRYAQCETLRQAAQAPASGEWPGHAPTVAVISGPGGVGKTTFAVHAGHRLADMFPDGQLFADLRGQDDQPAHPAQVALRFLAALGVPADRAADPVALFRSAAATRRLLLLLDNVADESQVAPLLPGSARCLVIVTSRQALGALASPCPIRLDVFSKDEAAALLSRVAGSGQLTSASETASLAELCGYLPLALRIAGSRLAAGPAGKPGWLVDRLRDTENRLRYLATGDLDLSSVFAASYRTLDDSTRRVFRTAGVFPGPDFTATALAILGDISVVEAECALERLVDASMLAQAGPGRYRMHDLLRLYAGQRAEQETEPAQRASAIRRLAAWYLVTAEAADRVIMPTRRRPAPLPGDAQFPAAVLSDPEAVFAWYDAELANLIAAARAAARHGHHAIAWRLPVAIRGVLELRGYTDDWIIAHRTGLESSRAAADRHAEGWILNGLGIGYWRRGAHAEAVECLQQALAIRAELADDRGVAVALNNLGGVYAAAGRYDEAIDALHQALAIREKISDGLDKSFALNTLGHIQHELGHFRTALPLLEEALQIRRDQRNRNGEAATLHCLGDTLTGLGRHLEALACFRKALPVFRHLGNRYGEAAVMHSIGSTFRALGRREHASRYLRRAIWLYRELGHGAEEASATRELAEAGQLTASSPDLRACEPHHHLRGLHAAPRCLSLAG